MSIEVEHEFDIQQQLCEVCHGIQQPAATTLALAAAALTEPDLPGATRDRLEQIMEQSEWLGLSAVARNVVMYGGRMDAVVVSAAHALASGFGK